MNVERINLLADVIEVEPEVKVSLPRSGFDMRREFHECGSPACIEGYARKLFRCPLGEDLLPVLGITPSQAIELFMPGNCHASFLASPGNPLWVTPQHAAAVLRHLARTGKVDWSVRTSPMEDTETPYGDGAERERVEIWI